MTTIVVLLTLLFLALAALLLNLNLHSSWHWPIKVVAVVVTFGLVVASYFYMDRLFGWPTSQALPSGDFSVIAASVREPNKRTGGEGAIYLWVRNAVSATPIGDEPPRAYRLPYSKAMHQATLNALKRLSQGKRQGARTGKDGRAVEFFDLTRRLPPKRGQ